MQAPMDSGSTFAPPPLPVRARISSDETASDTASDAWSSASAEEQEEEELAFESEAEEEEEEKAAVLGAAGDLFFGNAGMPRARVSADDDDEEGKEESDGEDGEGGKGGVLEYWVDGILGSGEDVRDGFVEGPENGSETAAGTLGSGVGFGGYGMMPVDVETADSSVDEGADRVGEEVEPTEAMQEVVGSSGEGEFESKFGFLFGEGEDGCGELKGDRPHGGGGFEDVWGVEWDSLERSGGFAMLQDGAEVRGMEGEGDEVAGSSVGVEFDGDLLLGGAVDASEEDWVRSQLELVGVGIETAADYAGSEQSCDGIGVRPMEMGVGSLDGEGVEEGGSRSWDREFELSDEVCVPDDLSSVESELTSVSNSEIGGVNFEGTGDDEPLSETEQASGYLEGNSGGMVGSKEGSCIDGNDKEIAICNLVVGSGACASFVSSHGGIRKHGLHQDGEEFWEVCSLSEDFQKARFLEDCRLTQNGMDEDSVEDLLENSRDTFSRMEGMTADFCGETELEAGRGDKNELYELAALAAVLNSSKDASFADAPQADGINEEGKLVEKLHQIRVKYLQLLHRLCLSPLDTTAIQVLERLCSAQGLKHTTWRDHAFGIENAGQKALHVEVEGGGDLEFSCNILVLGKSGVGKSATINSIFGRKVSDTDAFAPGTKCVKEICDVVDGVKLRVIDTPGLSSSMADQAWNLRVLASIKKFMRKYPPDAVLYVDRLDTPASDSSDFPLLRLISSRLGPSIWSNAIAVLTHASYAPMDGPNGTHDTYGLFAAKRSRSVQCSMHVMAGDAHQANSVVLVENHPSYRREGDGEMVLPNGETWRPGLLLLCYSLKILSELKSLLNLHDPSPVKRFGFDSSFPPLRYLLSTLFQSRAPPMPYSNHSGESDNSGRSFKISSSPEDGEDRYAQVQPFSSLEQSEITKLSEEERRTDFNGCNHRGSFLQKKQLKGKLRKMKEAKKVGGRRNSDYRVYSDGYDLECGCVTVPITLSDMVSPLSFECDGQCYRCRCQPATQLVVQPILDNCVWDHDCGYSGVSLEESFLLGGLFPAEFSVQIRKDKKECNIHLNSSVLPGHGKHTSTLACFDIQTIGRQLAYTLRHETKFRSAKRNKMISGGSLTFLGEDVIGGLKLEDRLHFESLDISACIGAVCAQNEFAYGGTLETCFHTKGRTADQDMFSAGFSLVECPGDLVVGANVVSEYFIGRNSKMSVCLALNSKHRGKINIRTSTSDQPLVAFLGIISFALYLLKKFWTPC